MMKNTILPLSLTTTLLLAAHSLSAADTTAIHLAGQKLGPQVKTTAEGNLRIAPENPLSTALDLFEIKSPQIRGESFVIEGEIRYADVDQAGFLEMWTHLPAKGDLPKVQFFSRTMAISGPMQKIHGSSDWRSFQLPAMIDDGSKRLPTKLDLNLYLPGKGWVEIRNVSVRSPYSITTPTAPATADSDAAPNNPESPSTDKLAGLVGTVVGVAIAVTAMLLYRAKRNKELRQMSHIDTTSSQK